jgi:Mn2+/Fe2+ NRAMP family transporter
MTKPLGYYTSHTPGDSGLLADMESAWGIMPGLSISIAFIMAVCVSSFGAIVTAPYSWQIIYGQSQRLASIGNKNERLLTVLGFMLLSGFLLAAFVASYTFDIISTNYATKNMMLAVAIVCSGDICFLLANILWIMSQFAKVSQGEMTASASYGRQTVSDSNGRFK